MWKKLKTSLFFFTYSSNRIIIKVASNQWLASDASIHFQTTSFI